MRILGKCECSWYRFVIEEADEKPPHIILSALDSFELTVIVLCAALLSVAVALMGDPSPSVVFLDEPSTGMDPVGKQPRLV